ncbi:MAG: isoprenylcysteine carboxylmethyltransferase family protein [Hydrogenophaga sp.]|uniref:methyltransferase family protein n=1 Tax=Hydrogenophaga sp. TaxID=1904254 RepID=UPI0025C0AC93|nr:isoprenylcysteine carboxylmethyltransferase family protein [Hydrogenophaga sp.]MBT9553679.1 isoprenylcysteine carboxylmethyltransferase family protein [Hydrogenophaga sp.]
MNTRWLELKVPPPVVGLVVGVAMWFLAPLGPGLAVPDPARLWLALAVAAVGAGFDLTGLIAFVRRHTTVNPLRPTNTSALVTSGVYRITRNPMYLGMACLLTAWAVWLGALWPWLGPVAFVLYITRFQIQPEERVLTTLFGEAYTAYTRRVRRWL